MIYLVLSVTFSVLVSVLLKIAKRKKISIEVAIGTNYLVALLLSWFLLHPDFSHEMKPISFVIIGALGVLLPSIFVILGKSVRYAGIVKTDAAQRLSLIIALIAAFTVLGEDLKTKTLLGIVVALVALGCLLHKPGLTDASSGDALSRFHSARLLLGVWLGFGSIDILFKQMSKEGTAFSVTLFLSFSVAAVIMWGYLLWRMKKDKETNIEDMIPVQLTKQSLIGGVILGCLNFANIYFYIQAHIAMSKNPSVVFAGMNMGVISLGTIIGAFFFKEKISWINGLGIAVALVAIALLNF